MKFTTLLVILPVVLLTTPATAQTASKAKTVRETFGARLAPVGPGDLPINDRSVSRRLETRVNSRIESRIERFRLTTDPLATSRAQIDDGTRKQVKNDPVPQDESPQ